MVLSVPVLLFQESLFLCLSPCGYLPGELGGFPVVFLLYVTAAKKDFKGRFSESFHANATTASSDADALAAALRTVAGYVGQVIDAGREEDARRRANNEWVREHNDRNLSRRAGTGSPARGSDGRTIRGLKVNDRPDLEGKQTSGAGHQPRRLLTY